MYDNLIDLHAHILPHLDDGARNIGQAISMAKAACTDGIKTIVCTPHFLENKARGALARRLDALVALRKALQEHRIDLELLPGFEVNATHALLARRSLGSLSLAGTRWILLERPYLYGDEFDAVADAAIAQGLRPLIAHPERYPYFTIDYNALERLVERGAWVQITSTALVGLQGNEIQDWCIRAFEIGVAHVVATDMHNLNSRSSQMQASAIVLAHHFGDDKMREIIYHNPARLLGRRL